MAGTSPHVLAGRIGGYARAKNIRDMSAAMEPAWRGQMARFEREVDPDGTLPAEERTRRAKSAQREAMARLALRSHTARRKAREARAAAAALAAEAAAAGVDPDTLTDGQVAG